VLRYSLGERCRRSLGWTVCASEPYTGIRKQRSESARRCSSSQQSTQAVARPPIDGHSSPGPCLVHSSELTVRRLQFLIQLKLALSVFSLHSGQLSCVLSNSLVTINHVLDC